MPLGTITIAAIRNGKGGWKDVRDENGDIYGIQEDCVVLWGDALQEGSTIEASITVKDDGKRYAFHPNRERKGGGSSYKAGSSSPRTAKPPSERDTNYVWSTSSCNATTIACEYIKTGELKMNECKDFVLSMKQAFMDDQNSPKETPAKTITSRDQGFDEAEEALPF